MKAATPKENLLTATYSISIHAAREGGDRCVCPVIIQNEISIHAAREGGDFCAFSTFASISAFQSTPPVKAATQSATDSSLPQIISIHAAREGGDGDIIAGAALEIISIHAAREGGDLKIRIFAACPTDFNPRRP